MISSSSLRPRSVGRFMIVAKMIVVTAIRTIVTIANTDGPCDSDSTAVTISNRIAGTFSSPLCLK